MNKKRVSFFLLFVIALLFACSNPSNLIVLRQITGLTPTNTYLIYDSKTKEAALVDVGGSIDSLETVINDENLSLKYLFITHAHCDHVEGIPAIKEKYPEAQMCCSLEEYEDFQLYLRWEEILDPLEVAELKKYPAAVKMANFDYSLLGKPDIFVKDDETYKLGNIKIRTLLSPGHSRGSICFYTEKALFSGDVLFYQRVGRTDFPESGGPEAIVKSVRKLYESLPDETIVYPGHGQFTDIGHEKLFNKEVGLTYVNTIN